MGGEGDFGQNAEGGFGLRVEKQGRFWVGSMSEDMGEGEFGWPSKVQQKCNSEKMGFTKVTSKPLREMVQPERLELSTF